MAGDYTNWHVGMKVWRTVPDCCGRYEVSNHGEVRNSETGLILKGSPVPRGYLTVAIHWNGERKTRTVHRMVAEAFHPNDERKPTVNHIDGNRTNNRADNLEWATWRENTLNGVQRGTITGVSKRVPEQDRAAIRARYKAGGISLRKLGAEYGLSKFGVEYILKEA
jgi:hypothetical protein